jgi:hypothetical protein
MNRLLEILSNAYELGMQAQDGRINAELAEEVAGECAEMLALLNEDQGSFGDEDCIDQELLQFVKLIKEVS